MGNLLGITDAAEWERAAMDPHGAVVYNVESPGVLIAFGIVYGGLSALSLGGGVVLLRGGNFRGVFLFVFSAGFAIAALCEGLRTTYRVTLRADGTVRATQAG